MIKKQTYLATYKHSEYWFVEVYKSAEFNLVNRTHFDQSV